MAGQRKKPSRRGATTQRRAPRKSGGFRIPGVVWGIVGVAAGFFLAHHQNGTAPWQERPDETPQATVLPKPSGGGEQSGGSQPSMPTFEFYTLLPETEVIAPGGVLPSEVNRPEIAASSSSSSDDSASSSNTADDDPIAQVIAANTRPEERAAAAESASAAASAPAQPANNTRYMLQAASFRDLADAEQLRGRLRNLSLLAQISEVQAGGNTWHRVQVGPYEDTRELNRAQDLMTTQGIEPLLIQLQN